MNTKEVPDSKDKETGVAAIHPSVGSGSSKQQERLQAKKIVSAEVPIERNDEMDS